MGRRGYPPELRRKVLDLVEAGRPIAEVAKAFWGSSPSRSTPGAVYASVTRPPPSDPDNPGMDLGRATTM